MSIQNLTSYLDKNPLCVPKTESDRVAVLITDSKGRYLDKCRTAFNLPLAIYSYSGARTSTIVDNFLNVFPKLSKDHKKPIVVYVWTGTCDITKKRSHHIVDLRYKEHGTATERIIEQYDKLITSVCSSGGFVKFICSPAYSCSIYNKQRHHQSTDGFKNTDSAIIKETDELNSRIKALNDQFGRNTLQFNLDLVKERSRARKSINFHLLKDGIHPDTILAKKWLRRLELDVIKECWIGDKFIVSVDPQELLSI